MKISVKFRLPPLTGQCGGGGGGSATLPLPIVVLAWTVRANRGRHFRMQASGIHWCSWSGPTSLSSFIRKWWGSGITTLLIIRRHKRIANSLHSLLCTVPCIPLDGARAASAVVRLYNNLYLMADEYYFSFQYFRMNDRMTLKSIYSPGELYD